MEQYTEMKVVELRTVLKKHHLSSKGNKSVLLKRIEEFVCPVPVPALVEQDVKGTDSMIPENIPNVGKESVVVADPTNFDPELPKLVTKSEIKAEEIKMEELALETEKTENLSAVPPLNPTPPINIAQRDTSQNKRNSHAFSPPPSMPNRKKKKVKGPPQTKNSLMVLNEMQPGLKYELVEQTQGSNGNSPSFTYELEFKGVMYRGSGSSKKIAKRNTATAALQRQIQFEQPHVIASCFVPMIPTAMDFTSDDLDFYQQPYMVPIPQAQEMQMQSLPPPPIPPFAQLGMQMP
uniref:SAP domain-containing protein n=1 Tax=Ciona savignyi TaxID=51511 RepID=H2Z8X7_CIOSA